MRFSKIQRPRFAIWLALTAIGTAGCGSSDDIAPTQGLTASDMKPVAGKITLNGKPLEHAVVAFFDKNNEASVGESDEEGKYTLRTRDMNGAPAGEYKVAVSYYLAPNGKPQGLAQRSAMVQSEDMMTSKETLPPEYSDLKQTKLRATVTQQALEFNFDLNADPKPPAKAAPKAPADGEAPTKTEPAPAKGETEPAKTAPSEADAKAPTNGEAPKAETKEESKPKAE